MTYLKYSFYIPNTLFKTACFFVYTLCFINRNLFDVLVYCSSYILNTLMKTAYFPPYTCFVNRHHASSFSPKDKRTFQFTIINSIFPVLDETKPAVLYFSSEQQTNQVNFLLFINFSVLQKIQKFCIAYFYI